MTDAFDATALLRDLRQVAELAGTPIADGDIQVEELDAPHSPPTRLKRGRMAVYVFIYQGQTLKVGKAGPRSQARYCSQHYNPGSALSTLSASILHRGPSYGLPSLTKEEVPNWIKQNTDRVNYIIEASYGIPVLTLMEAFLQCRLDPLFEGFASQKK